MRRKSSVTRAASVCLPLALAAPATAQFAGSAGNLGGLPVPERRQPERNLRAQGDAGCARGEGDVTVCRDRALTVEGRRAIAQFAKCAAHKLPFEAMEVVSAGVTISPEPTPLNAFVKRAEGCLLNGELTSSRLLMAGALAESLIDLGNAADLAHSAAYDPSRAAITARDASEMLGFCLVREAPGDIAHLLATKAGETAESRAAARVVARVGECVPRDKSVRLNLPGLRAIVAIAALRLAEQNAAVRIVRR